MKFVIARYNENLHWATRIDHDVLIYNKGGDFPQELPEVKLENIGREQYSFYYHIYNNYNNLDDYTVFLQGDPFPHSNEEMIKGIAASDFEALGWYKVDAHSHAVQYRLKEPIEKAVTLLGLTPFSWDYHFTAGGQFVASKETLQKYPKSFYKNILDMWGSDWGKTPHAGHEMNCQDFIFEHLNSVIYL